MTDERAKRIYFFIVYFFKSLFTLGIYPFYFHITRQNESNELFKEILENVKQDNHE